MRQLLPLILLLLSLNIFAQPRAGYYSEALGKADSLLRESLKTIIEKDHIVTTYNGLWTAYGQTDINPLTGKIWDMYSNCNFTWKEDQNTGSTGAECLNYNREHSIPQSWFGDAPPMVSDAFHVYPTDTKVNGIRGNFPFGEVGVVTTTTGNGSKLGTSSFSTYSGTVFEPINEFKGDFARTYFYMATRYAVICKNWSGGVFGSAFLGFTNYGKEIFLKWHRQDPVSSKEILRNNAVELVQYNRNPFIDFPDLAEYIWGTKKGLAWSLTSDIDNLKIEFSLSPNPVQNLLKVKTDENDLKYIVFDLKGLVILENSLSFDHTISVNSLQNGMYLLQLESGNRKSIQKFIVNN